MTLEHGKRESEGRSWVGAILSPTVSWRYSQRILNINPSSKPNTKYYGTLSIIYKKKERYFIENHSFKKQKYVLKVTKMCKANSFLFETKVMRVEKEKHMQFSRTLVLRWLACYMKHRPTGPPLCEGRVEEDKETTRGVRRERWGCGYFFI